MSAAPPEPRSVIRLQLPRRPVRATYALLAVIGVVFLGQLILAPFPGDADPIIEFGAKVNALIAAGEWWRLITPIFVHGSVLHFAFNAYALYNLGREIETFYGWARFVGLFFFAGVYGTVASIWFSPAPSVGASGAIFGLIGAEAVLLYRNQQLLGERARAGLQNIVLIAVVNLFIGFQAAARIDNWAHLGGLLGGAALAWVIGPVWRLAPAAEPGLPPTLMERGPFNWLAVAGLLGVLIVIIVSAIFQGR